MSDEKIENLFQAGKAHLIEILQQGSEAWNSWRGSNPAVTPDLGRAELYDKDLRGVNLQSGLLWAANLAGARLAGADLSGAFLLGANLHSTDLRAANLSRTFLINAQLTSSDLTDAKLCDARLTGANLQGANLTDTDLEGASLAGANISRTRLDRTNFTNTEMGWTILGGPVDLRRASGLKTVRHVGPSTIGIDTVVASHGEIPETFLKNAGVPDTFIGYVNSKGKPLVRPVRLEEVLPLRE